MNILGEILDFVRFEDHTLIHHHGREAKYAVERREQFVRERQADVAP